MAQSIDRICGIRNFLLTIVPGGIDSKLDNGKFYPKILIRKVKSMQRSETEAIRTRIQPLKTISNPMISNVRCELDGDFLFIADSSERS